MPTTAPAHATNINSFPVTLSNGGAYILTKDCTLGKARTCVVINGANTILYLNNHTVNGRVTCPYNCSGIEVYGGTINCSAPDSAALGCLYITDSGRSASTVKVHDLTGSNSADASGTAARWALIDWNGAPTGPISISVSHVTVWMDNASDAATTRIIGLGIQGGNLLKVDINNSKFTCGAGSAACQGVQLYGANGRFHNNFCDMKENSSEGDTSRCVLVDDDPNNYGAADAGHNEIDHLDCNAHNNRCVRVRNVQHTLIHHVIARSLSHTDGVNYNATAAFHIGDPDTGGDLDMDVSLYNITVQSLSTGVTLFARSESGVLFRDSTLTCTDPEGCRNGTGTLADVRQPLHGADTSLVTLERITGVSGIGFTRENATQSGATVDYCMSGSVNTDRGGEAVQIACN